MARKIKKFLFMTADEYLRFEESSKSRHEFVDGYVFAMSGTTEAHNLICTNLTSLIHLHLQGSPCRVSSNDLKLRIDSANCFYYPDLMVTCEKFEPKAHFKIAPVLLVEILSPSTESTDRREKLIAYKKLDSVRDYLIVHQDRQQVESFHKGPNQEWEITVLGVGDTLEIESLPNGILSIPISNIYIGYNPPGIVKELEALYEPGLVRAGLVDFEPGI
jgi:Uma2 family endonuclease